MGHASLNADKVVTNALIAYASHQSRSRSRRTSRGCQHAFHRSGDATYCLDLAELDDDVAGLGFWTGVDGLGSCTGVEGLGSCGAVEGSGFCAALEAVSGSSGVGDSIADLMSVLRWV